MSHFSLALMLTILANGVLFFHSHELENGRIITHAHPILTEEQEEQPDHGHTEMELIILDLIAHADYFVYSIEIDVPELPEMGKSVQLPLVSLELFQEVSNGFDLRGPPNKA